MCFEYFTSHMTGLQGRRKISLITYLGIDLSFYLLCVTISLRIFIMKIKSRWLCSCVMPARDVKRDHPHCQNGGAYQARREYPAADAASSTCSSIHQKKAVNISSRSGSGLSLQSKKTNFLRRFLEFITKRISSSQVHLLNASGADPNPEHRPGPRAGISKDLMTSELSPETISFSINLKCERKDPGPGISSQKHDIKMMAVPSADAPAVDPRQVRCSGTSNLSSIFPRTCGPMRLEDFVVMDGTFLGKGTFGRVRLCSDKSTGHLMACKTIEKVKMENLYDLHEHQACMIRREVNMHQLCSDHPNVVQMLGLFEDDAAVHILMEYCDAGCLSAILHQTFPQGLPVNTAAVGMKQLADALCWIHGKNIVHRDIKPDNILVAAKGRSVQTRLKVGDFGLALQLQPQQGKDSGVLIGPTSRCGSPGYMAPEVRRKEPYGTAVDIWSAGVSLCRMLTGERPFPHVESVRDLDFSLPQWRHVPDEARHLVSRMLEYDPQTRFTAAQILEHPWIKQHNDM